MIPSVVERLKEQVATLKLVGGAAEFERAAQGLKSVPAAFVMPAAEQAGPNQFMSQQVQQEVATQFAVVLAVRNLSDSEGAAALETLQPVRVAVRNALLGWVPEDCESGCEYSNGSLLSFVNGVLWWQEFYDTTYIIRSL